MEFWLSYDEVSICHFGTINSLQSSTGLQGSTDVRRYLGHLLNEPLARRINLTRLVITFQFLRNRYQYAFVRPNLLGVLAYKCVR